MKYRLTLILFIFSIHAYATHIVGGEIELIHIDSTLYQFNLIQYFDDVNGLPEAEDYNIQLFIFRKSDNVLIRSVTLFNMGSTFVPYTNIVCTIDKLITRRIFYSREIVLNPLQFNDPEGYYIVWERCCRNEVINNIQFPGATGQAFYLEFPAILKNNKPFFNTSPILFPPLSDYACVNNFYYVDFAGFDPDGDSLVYSMAHPLAGYSSPVPGNIIPPPRAAPYPVVQWIPGISTGNAVPGDPPLSISSDGLLTVIPSETGLFVFSVLCEEFRDGVKIGEVRRDFQMLVIDCPDPGIQPNLVVKTPGSNTYTEFPDTLVFSSDEEKCYEFIVKDRDGAENLNFRVNSVNFSANLEASLSINQASLEDPEDSVSFNFCFPDCPFLINQPHIVDIIVGDDTCPLPLLDTIRLVVYIEQPPNQPARFDTIANQFEYDILEGNIVTFNVKGTDADGDSLMFSVISQDFDTSDYQMTFNPIFPVPEQMDLNFNWDSSCQKYDFNDRQNFNVLLLLDDNDFCNIFNPDTIRLDINVDLPPNTSPEIFTDLGSDSVAIQILDSLFFNVFANDQDGDRINLLTFSDEFDLIENGFTPIQSSDFGSITERFGWILDCNTLDIRKGNEFSIDFIVEDDDKCKIRNSDTITIKFTALLPDNAAPTLEMVNISTGNVEVVPGDSIIIDLLGKDLDGDSIFVSILDQSNLLETTGAEFIPVSGSSQVSTSFTWKTDCSHLIPERDVTNYSYQFLIRDDKCLVPLGDTIDLTIVLKDLTVDYDDVFIPNVFTPNNDEFNDYFTVPNLPEDNCSSQFLSVAIYNRFGKEVFFSKQKEFRWYAQNVKNGVFFYHIKYTTKNYKGYLQVLY